MKQALLFGLLWILTGCKTAEVSTPAPTPEAIHVFYPAALQPWADQITSCASRDPYIAVYLFQSGNLEVEVGPTDIYLELGYPESSGAATYLSRIGMEQLVVVVNQENSLSRLSNDEVRSIFSGQTSGLQLDVDQSFQVWVLPEGEPTRIIFDQVVMRNQPITNGAMLAPDPAAMLEAVAQNEDAIGYLPGSFLSNSGAPITGKVKIIQLETALESLLLQPVIAVTSGEPEGLLRSLLVCLESDAP